MIENSNLEGEKRKNQEVINNPSATPEEKDEAANNIINIDHSTDLISDNDNVINAVEERLPL